MSVDVEDYLSGGCGVFAYALWIAYGQPARGEIGVISNPHGEPCSDDIPFEVTHAFFEIGDLRIDARGARSIAEMADEMGIGVGYDNQGSWTPDGFRTEMMGDDDEHPLYGEAADIAEALAFIEARRELYVFDLSAAAPAPV